MKITGAIFDMDGTLLESMHIWENVGRDFLLAHGVQPEPDLRERLRAKSLRQSAVYYREHYGADMPEDAIMAEINGMLEEQYFHVVQPKPGAEALLARLQERGVRMCVATSTARYLTEAALRRCGLTRYIGEIFTCEEVGAGKDSPEIFMRALEWLGGEKEHTPVFEDAYFAMLTAKTAGFPVVAVYDKSAEAQNEKIRAIADIYLQNYGEAEKYGI